MVYTMIRDEKFEIDKMHELFTDLKAMNNAICSHGLVSTLLISGFVPVLPIKPEMLPDQNARIYAMMVTHMETSRLDAQRV